MNLKLALILFAAPLFSQTGAIEKAILEVNTQMTQAAEARDIDRLFSFMLPNEHGSIAQSGVLFLTREDAQSSVKRGFTAIQKIAYRWKHQMVTVISPDTAILVADGENEATFTDGTTAVTPFAQTVIFVRKDSAWKALHAHQSAPPRR